MGIHAEICSDQQHASRPQERGSLKKNLGYDSIIILIKYFRSEHSFYSRYPHYL